MQELVITLFSGLGEGAIIALIAMSLNVLYNATGILNFAQGDFLIIGGVFAFIVVSKGTMVILVLLLTLGVAVLAGAIMFVQGTMTLARLRSSVDQHSWLITTLAASAIIESLILLIEGPAQLTVPNNLGTFVVNGIREPWLYPILFLMAIATYYLLRLFHGKTIFGLAMNALRQDLDAARAMGARVRILQLAAFGISGLIVGAAGCLGAPLLTLSQSSGINYTLNGFAAAVIGGLGNQTGALVAGPVLGILTEVAVFHLGGQYEQIAPLIMLIVVLLVRPEGVLGRATARRV